MTRTGVALVLIACAIGCKGKGKGNDKPKPDVAPKADPDVPLPPHPMPAPPPVVTPGDWAVCKAALEASPKLPVTKQVGALIDACRPCGDWKPLIEWASTEAEGGPKRKAIEDAMLGCKAYCDPNAKMRFQGALDDNRGKQNRAPWRMLGEFCKDTVSAVPDARFMSAPFFALDRIARDAATHPDAAKALAAIDLVLPAASLSGAGLQIPTSAVTKPSAAPSQLTVTVDDLRGGPLPHARLGASGVVVSDSSYPGAQVKLAELGATLDKLPGPVLVFAPQKMTAARLVEILAAGKRHTLQLALAATTTLPGWDVYGASPVELAGEVDPARLPKDPAQRLSLVVGDKTDDIVKQITAAPAAVFTAPVAIALEPSATVESLATVLGVLAYKDVKLAVVTSAKRPKP